MNYNVCYEITWEFDINELFHNPPYWAWDYLSLLRLKLSHVIKMRPRKMAPGAPFTNKV